MTPNDSMELVEIGVRAMLSESRKPGVGISNPAALVRAILTAIEASGRRIVPVEPTIAMIEAGMVEEATDLASEYRAMLFASPKVTP
jgi:hypothetical protein